jgi:hypothetical protein
MQRKGRFTEMITPKQFVDIARKAASIAEIMTTTGLTKPGVANRLSRYRKAGVERLPNFDKPNKIDVEKLNATE